MHVSPRFHAHIATSPHVGILLLTDFLRPGTNDPMPGLIGKAYADMGGTVNYVGKPHPAVYQACCDALLSGQVSWQAQP